MKNIINLTSTPRTIIMLALLFVILRIISAAITLDLSGGELIHLENGHNRGLSIYRIAAWLTLLPFGLYISILAWNSRSKINSDGLRYSFLFFIFLVMIGFISELFSAIKIF